MLERMSPRLFIMHMETNNKDHGHEKYRISSLMELYVLLLKSRAVANSSEATERIHWRKCKEVSIFQPWTILLL